MADIALQSFVYDQLCLEKDVILYISILNTYILGCRQKMKIFLPPLFRSGLTQGSIWRLFFGRRGSSSLT